MSSVVSPMKIANDIQDLWSPKVIGAVDDAYVKVAKVKGTFTWHSHEHEDEFFYVLKGELRIELEQETVLLGEGDVYDVPKGVRHRPAADDECLIMLLERKTTQHTGGEKSDLTRTIDDQLAAYRDG
jgi:mannose-6-phosphate isomerase-like protein (cupin superfamily)